MSLLEVNGLNAYYGDSHILFDVSLRVEKHEAVALVGRNGAGKSTTLKSLMGVVARRCGSIKLDGVELVAQKAHNNGHIAHEGPAAEIKARALVRDPKIILLDEPFEGLAPIIVQDLVHTCRELARSGQTIVLVEQNLAATLAQPGLLQRYLGV
jgi:branched-chain amino acid transport system ATP-binding protein